MVDDTVPENPDDVARVLLAILEHHSERPSEKEIANKTAFSRSKVHRRIEEAEKFSLLKLNRNTNPTSKVVTPSGSRLVEKVDPYSSERTGDAYSDFGMVDLHYVTVVLQIHNRDFMPDDWKETIVERNSNAQINESNKTVTAEKDCFDLRFTSEKVVVRFKENLKGYDVDNLKFEVFDRVKNVKQWIEDRTPLNFDDRYLMKYDVRSQHLAVLHDPLVKMIKESEKVVLSDSDVIEDEGEILLWLDDSEGSEGHLEAGGGNAPGGLVEFGEDAVNKIQSFYVSVVRNWEDDWSFLLDEVRDGLVEKVKEAEDTAWKNRERIEENREKLEEVEDRLEGFLSGVGQATSEEYYHGELPDLLPAVDRDCHDKGGGE